jgi:hypothetical protein
MAAATPGTIPYSSIPSPVPIGLIGACQAAEAAAGFSSMLSMAPDGWEVADVPTVMATIASYVGSPAELAFHKTAKQTALDATFDTTFDLAKFIRGGTLTTVTAANVGSFLAQITNNYRGLRSSISNSSATAVTDAINVTAGWPANP